MKTFLRFSAKYKVKPSKRVPQGKFSLHLEEMKLPPMGDDLVLKSATVVPMLTSEWQAHQHSDSRELQNGSDKFFFDGKFVANPKLLGEWTTIGQVPSIEEFTPGNKKKLRRARIGRRIFKDGGRTDSVTWIWSGDTLVDLSGYQALKMKVEEIGGEDYLFIEAGGFSAKNPVGWQSPWHVMKRQAK